MNRLLLLAATTPPTLTNDSEVSPYNPATWGWGQWVALVGILSTLITLYVQFRKTKGDEVTGNANIKMTLDKMIDERVERNLKQAYDEIDDLKNRVGSLEADLGKERQEKSRIKTIVKRLLATQLHWDRDGRVGDLPMPSEEDLAVLDIEPWSDTAQKRMIDSVRHELQSEGESYE